MSSPTDHRPIIIVAAGRSGTKLLRGILASHPEVVCFPREINYIWRHGNASFPTDELRPEHARPGVIRYIRNRFDKLGASRGGQQVVEKTCANVLRVDYVHAVLPDAFIVHLVRDGRAVAESARRRWLASPEPRYLWEKARWLPWSDVPYYAWRYLRYQWGRLGSNQRAQTSWGPRFAGLDELVREKTLIEVCGLQWKVCVQAACAAMERVPPEQTLTVRYEELVTKPMAVSEQIFDRLRLAFTPQSRDHIENEVHQRALSKWRENLSEDELQLLLPLIESELSRQGYQL